MDRFTVLAIIVGLFLSCMVWSLLYTPPLTDIVFSGKVVNSATGEWPNQRLVILFLNGKEIGRAETNLGEFAQSKQGLVDGEFAIQVPNLYRIDQNSFATGENQPLPFQHDGKDPFIYHWFDPVAEGGTLTVRVPAKNARYVLKSLAGPTTDLPAEVLQPGVLALQDTGTIILVPRNASGTPEPGAATARVAGVTYKTKTEKTELRKLTIPLNNCGGSARVTRDQTYSQTFVREYQAETAAGVSVGLPTPPGWPTLVLELQAKYGFTQGQVDTAAESTHLEAEPGTNTAYVLTWTEIWESGSADMLRGTDRITIPFRVKTNMIASLDSTRLPCP